MLDLTCGSGRLLAPFAQRGHQVLGIELDERLTPVAKRAVGQQGIIRQGDICAYAPTLPDKGFDVAVINPPYGLWWPAVGPLADYTLASTGEGYDGSIESQNMVLELATHVLTENYYDGGFATDPIGPWTVGSGSQELNGTYDMMGNNWEWMESPWGDPNFGAGSSRGLRSGDWGSYSSDLQSSYRDFLHPANERSDGSISSKCATAGPLTTRYSTPPACANQSWTSCRRNSTCRHHSIDPW